MLVEMRPIDTIRPYDNNPRHNDAAVDAVAASIKAVRLPPAHRRRRARRHHRRPHALQGGAEAGHDGSAGPCRRRPDAGPGRRRIASPTTRPPRCPAGTTSKLLDGTGRPAGDGLRPRPDRLLGRRAAAPAGLGRQRGPVRSRRRARAARRGHHAARAICGCSAIIASCAATAAKPEDVDRLLDGAADPSGQHGPAVQREGRAARNNAIAAGLSSFQGTTHHQGLDVARHPGKPSRRRKSCGPRTGRWPTTSSPTRSSTACCAPGSATWPACCCRAGPSTSGAATPTSATTRRC